jgi:hypothetical protein
VLKDTPFDQLCRVLLPVDLELRPGSLQSIYSELLGQPGQVDYHVPDFSLTSASLLGGRFRLCSSVSHWKCLTTSATSMLRAIACCTEGDDTIFEASCASASGARKVIHIPVGVLRWACVAGFRMRD